MYSNCRNLNGTLLSKSLNHLMLAVHTGTVKFYSNKFAATWNMHMKKKVLAFLLTLYNYFSMAERKKPL